MASFLAVLVVSAFATGSAVDELSKLVRTESSAEDASSKLVRRHENAVAMGATGDFSQVSEPRSKPKEDIMARFQEGAVREMLDRVNRAKRDANLCNDNFTQGVAMTNDCTDPDHQFHMEDDTLCASAALLSCPDKSCLGPPFGTFSEPFNLASIYYNGHPKRCYIENDPTNETRHGKWFFNPSGYEPADISSGIPVCVQPEFKEGTADSNDCVSDKYEPIMDEFECRQAATCLASCIHDEFRILDAEEAKNAPKGCHNSTVGCIRLNDNATAGTGTPKGTPICAHR